MSTRVGCLWKKSTSEWELESENWSHSVRKLWLKIPDIGFNKKPCGRSLAEWDFKNPMAKFIRLFLSLIVFEVSSSDIYTSCYSHTKPHVFEISSNEVFVILKNEKELGMMRKLTKSNQSHLTWISRIQTNSWRATEIVDSRRPMRNTLVTNNEIRNFHPSVGISSLLKLFWTLILSPNKPYTDSRRYYLS